MGRILHHQHPWNLTLEEALQVQADLRERVRVRSLSDDSIQTICGVDVAYKDNQACAAAVVLDYPTLQIVDLAQSEMVVGFPYIPGLFAFRELPVILEALGKLDRLPDLILVDGHGLAHPRRFGSACHLGVLLQAPVIGVAKSILIGEMSALDLEPGSIADIVHQNEVVGVALRTRRSARPVYLSVGYGVDLATCVRVIMGCSRGHRLPEPCRLAHQFARLGLRGVDQA